MKNALVIIDIQNDYFDGGRMTLVNADGAAARARQLLDSFRSAGQPVVHVQHVFTSPDAPFFLPDTEGVQINKAVEPAAGEKVVVKNYPNSFKDSELLSHLRENGITDVTICGMMTHMCVDATTRAAKDLGFNCTVVGDACATLNLELDGKKVDASDVQVAFLSALNGMYADVTTTDAYIK